MIGLLGVAALGLLAYEAETGDVSAKYQASIKPAIEKRVDAEYNSETGQTDFTFFGEEFSLDTEFTYDLND